jgi:alkylation response protein AidB-like acyl-CoA dehydrogenase
MDFELTKEQEAIRRMARQFAERKLAPIATEIDREAKIPPDIHAELRKLKLFGIPHDKKYGGGGESYVELVLVIEEVAKASAGVSLMLAAHYLAPISLSLYGTEEQKEQCLPKLCSGEGIGTFAFTEAWFGTYFRQNGGGGQRFYCRQEPAGVFHIEALGDDGIERRTSCRYPVEGCANTQGESRRPRG